MNMNTMSNDNISAMINEAMMLGMNDEMATQVGKEMAEVANGYYPDNALFEVRYMNGGDGELLMDNASEIEAKAHMDELYDTMDAENFADVRMSMLMGPRPQSAELAAKMHEDMAEPDLAKQEEDEVYNMSYEDILSDTTTTEDEVMNTEKQETIAMEEVNKSAILSTMSAELFQVGLNPRVALIAACAWVGAADYMDDIEEFLEAFMDGLQNISIEVKDAPDQPLDEIDGEAIMTALCESDYLELSDDECTMEARFGPRFEELLSKRTEAYRPVLATQAIERRFGYAPTKFSPLFMESIHALESTQYTVDTWMLSIAKQVTAQMGGTDEDKEGYVIRGCEMMDGSLGYVSEFKGDRRLRKYQASCHGPNGQASDRSRALMDLYGVPTDYGILKTQGYIKDEMSDMVSVKDSKERAQLVKDAVNDPVAFIIKHITMKEDESAKTQVSKPYSFVKAARILVKLHNGERPYIGMAIGKDCKCSGPQLGALMVGDQAMAQACGFSLQQVEDAYHRAIAQCAKAGFHGFEREDIKKPFMGIFYGQGWAAFMDATKVAPEVWAIIHGEDDMMGDEDKAKAFHKAVCASFGAKMMAVRNAIKAYADHIEGKIKHHMPDGSLVAMNYKKKVNVLGEAMDYDTPVYDVYLNNNAESYKFINFQLNTSETHCGDFARNGFVNMIQGTDALLASLVIVYLKRMGADHIISVHDCFRVNVTQMDMLDEAIKQAYTELFGGERNKATKDLPLGKDILGLYFEGANKQVVDPSKTRMISQFFTSGKRRMYKVAGVSLMSLIKQLGKTYYFAK